MQPCETEQEVCEGIPLDFFICNPNMFWPNHGFLIPLAEPDINSEEEPLERTNWSQVAADLESTLISPYNYYFDSVPNQQHEMTNFPSCEERNSILESSYTEFESVPVDYNSSEVDRVLDNSFETTQYESLNSQELYRPSYNVEEDLYSSQVFDSTVHIPPPATVVFAGSIYDSRKNEYYSSEQSRVCDR
ncbi:hypothetical protein GpartN1_g1002.t1 [Galdieria partita]|uniref:Uncharacterized protein n=1 Tax=Galdieria partita TaxID=83374 RepID=A0A9C7PSW5_9RHOD|nr:hypothetical protein GpartN1_g1002.t1 [Galdieria partita]